MMKVPQYVLQNITQESYFKHSRRSMILLDWSQSVIQSPKSKSYFVNKQYIKNVAAFLSRGNLEMLFRKTISVDVRQVY